MYKIRLGKWGARKYAKKQAIALPADVDKISQGSNPRLQGIEIKQITDNGPVANDGSTPNSVCHVVEKCPVTSFTRSPGKLPLQLLFDALHGIYNYQECNWAYDASLNMLCNVKYDRSEKFSLFNRLIIDGAEALIQDKHKIGLRMLDLGLEVLRRSELLAAMDVLYSAVSRFAYLSSRGDEWCLLSLSLLRCLRTACEVMLPTGHHVTMYATRLEEALKDTGLSPCELAQAFTEYVGMVNAGIYLIPVWIEMWRCSPFIQLQKHGFKSQTKIGSLIGVSKAVDRRPVPLIGNETVKYIALEKVGLLLEKWRLRNDSERLVHSTYEPVDAQYSGITRGTWLEMAETHSAVGNVQAAKRAFEEALKLSDQTWGPNSSESIRTMTSMTYRSQKRGISVDEGVEREIVSRYNAMERRIVEEFDQ